MTRRPGSQAFQIAAYVALAAGIVLPAAKMFPPKVRPKPMSGMRFDLRSRRSVGSRTFTDTPGGYGGDMSRPTHFRRLRCAPAARQP